jgi:hypothetical protein
VCTLVAFKSFRKILKSFKWSNDFQTEIFGTESDWPSWVELNNVIRLVCFIVAPFPCFVIMLLTVYMHMCELWTSSQALIFGTAKPNSDHGKSVKSSINNPIYRRGWCQSTVDMETRWTGSHQHQQHASSSNMSIFSNTNAKEKNCIIV